MAVFMPAPSTALRQLCYRCSVNTLSSHFLGLPRSLIAVIARNMNSEVSDLLSRQELGRRTDNTFRRCVHKDGERFVDLPAKRQAVVNSQNLSPSLMGGAASSGGRIPQQAATIFCRRAIVNGPGQNEGDGRTVPIQEGQLLTTDLTSPTTVIAVNDLGGGTFDISILEMQKDVFEGQVNERKRYYWILDFVAQTYYLWMSPPRWSTSVEQGVVISRPYASPMSAFCLLTFTSGRFIGAELLCLVVTTFLLSTYSVAPCLGTALGMDNRGTYPAAFLLARREKVDKTLQCGGLEGIVLLLHKMGVTGLWDVTQILRPSGKLRSLTHIAVVDGFEANPANFRGLRIGIDASIWFFHAVHGREGENPELHTLFFRCARLMSAPFLPLFIFDGPKRPKVKRGKRISDRKYWLVDSMKEIIEAFGFEWRMAPGEAEAELAHLNSIGVIDAVLSDDVDNFLFGAKMVIRSSSVNLSGNSKHTMTNVDGRVDDNHSTSLTRDELHNFLITWCGDLCSELRTNSRGHLSSKMPSLAKAVPDAFPDIDVLLSYTNPIISATDARACHTHTPPRWEREPDLGRLAHLCESRFEWGLKDIIIKRFRTILWPSFVLRALRRSVLEAAAVAAPGVPGGKERRPLQATPSTFLARDFSSLGPGAHDTGGGDAGGLQGLIVNIHGSRMHAYTDGILEYRLEVAPAQLVYLARAGIQESRKPADTTYDVLPSASEDSGGDPDDRDTGTRKRKRGAGAPLEPDSHLRMWMPACMVRPALLDLVKRYEAELEAKRTKKLSKGKQRALPLAKAARNGNAEEGRIPRAL
ncbi:hypothetical protein EDB84DRAFT_1440318 [Lactarius hengduanensis]|nr:hypothetical protein EDB84DRAFT_1440318 [Lactarius hengduanensis]